MTMFKRKRQQWETVPGKYYKRRITLRRRIARIFTDQYGLRVWCIRVLSVLSYALSYALLLFAGLQLPDVIRRLMS